jgi:pimeloyl-ACP methyl ester carboxylesterase
MQSVKTIDAGALRITFRDAGPSDGIPVFLMHGFPYDVHSYDDVEPILERAGCRVITPFLRGYGQTRFLDADTPRSGEQAAFGNDLRALMDALDVDRAVVSGYDWGGRAACVVSALWPERVIGLVSAEGYNIQDIARSGEPVSPHAEHSYWYQYYFHSERGRAGLTRHRYELTRLLWSLWSPEWDFDETTFARSAQAFENEDFVDVVIHSYRHRYGLVPGDPTVASIEAQLAAQPLIKVPTVALFGATDGVAGLSERDSDACHFTGPYETRTLSKIGHNIPQEAPTEFADAVLSLI